MKTEDTHKKLEKNESMLPGVKIAFISGSFRLQKLVLIIKKVFKK